MLLTDVDLRSDENRLNLTSGAEPLQKNVRRIWRQRYRSLFSQYTGKNARVLAETWSKYSSTLSWKLIFKPSCATTVLDIPGYPRRRKDWNSPRKCSTSLFRRNNQNDEV